MTNDEQTRDASGVALTDLLAKPWYLLGSPWASSDYAGTVILAGSEDPHIGTAVCDTFDMLAENSNLETARAVAEHIARLHNASLNAG